MDERRLKQVLLNILSNAIKFTNKGSITIKVRNNEKEKKIWIAIKDTGMGIKDEDLSKLFQEFQMLDTHKSYNPNGNSSIFIMQELD